ncbi:MAG: hypothetical protein JXA23_06875 [Bacteroidales bacterium]|nr:hypothetical protein [Bacteroidales bacterium]
MRSLLLTSLLLLTGLLQVRGETDSTTLFIIDRIILNGNKITHPRIILRELKFSEGDTLTGATLPEALQKSRENIFNTSLFNVVELDTALLSFAPIHLAVTVNVIERWYIWPIPYIEFPNRNINAWLETWDFSRLTYGLNFKFFNARGRNETLTLLLHLGFNQQYGFTYQTPYINKQQTWGFGFGGDYDRNRSLITGTTGNKSNYLDTASGSLQQRIHGFAEGYFRPSLYGYHTFSLAFDYYHFADTLLKIPGYLTDSTNDQSFITLYYKYKLDHRDVRYYPLQGYYFDLELTKQGFSGHPVDLFSIQSTFRKYWKFAERWFLAAGVTAKWSWPEEQPFYLQHGIGYGRDLIRGFEYYSINGSWFGLVKTNLKFALVKPRILKLSFIHTPKFGILPLGLFLNLFADAGYVHNSVPLVKQDNPLVNNLLAGYGISIDLVTYYDIVLDLNFAMNSLGEPGIYIHFIAPI